MNNLFSGFTADRNPAGQLVITFTAPIGIHLIAAVIVPLVAIGVMHMVFAGGPLGAPWWLYIGFAALGALSIVFLLWFGARSLVRVVVDRQKSSLVVQTRDGRTELPMADLEGAAIGSIAGQEASTGYRLELVRRNGERIPATASYFSFYREGDRARVIDAINQELKTRAGMAK